LPDSREQLPEALARRFHGQVAGGLDLSSIGYHFDRVGRCTVPGTGSVHLIYRAMAETGRQDAISLWIRPADEEFAVEPGTLHVRGAERAHPVLIWRQGEMVYFLTGDGLGPAKQAATALGAPVDSAV